MKTRFFSLQAVTPLALLLVLLGGWQILSTQLPPEILPAPADVWQRFLTAWEDGTYLPALGTTALEAALGWIVAAAVAQPLGYALGRIRALDAAIAPYLAALQAMPVVAIAPLLVVWVGLGLLPKVIVCALIAFFPMLASTASGIRGVPRDLRDAGRVFGAGRGALAVYVDIPLAARAIFAGLKISAALSVTGAVVGEFVSSDQGLGFLLTSGLTTFDTPLMFVALLSLMALGAAAYGLVSLTERRILTWEDVA